MIIQLGANKKQVKISNEKNYKDQGGLANRAIFKL